MRIPGFKLQNQVTLSLLLFGIAAGPPAVAGPAVAAPGERQIVAMGFPAKWKPYLSPLCAWDKGNGTDYITGDLTLGVYHDLLNPLMAPLGIAGEGYTRYPGGELDGGFRLLAVSRFFFLQAGWDYSFRLNSADFLLGLTVPLRRGGPLGLGDQLRIDWLPGRGGSLQLGLQIPIFQPHMGKTRPHTDHVTLPRAEAPDRSELSVSPVLGDLLVNVRHSVEWIAHYTTPLLDRSTSKAASDLQKFTDRLGGWKQHLRLTDSLYPNGHTFAAEIRSYHDQLVLSFSLALRSTDSIWEAKTSQDIAGKARALLLREVILPYDRLLGQRKENDSVLGYGKQATLRFEQWLRDSSEVPVASQPTVVFVFRSLLQYIEDSRKYTGSLWKDSRLVWIPLDYALRPEDHDTEDELDRLLELAVGQSFSEANDVHYVVNELLQPELERTIRSAEDYHVLWVHDFTGINGAGAPDSISYRLAVQTYLRSLIDRVKDYDRTGKLPVYMIFLDQHYYELHKSSLWLKLLRDPLHYRLKLPAGYEHWSDTIASYQGELRTTVASSTVLQAGRRRWGNGWLANKVSVHVNITNPSDISFRSRSLINGFAFVPDNLMRDHRKIAFYDVTELDPARGEALYTGMGVGEHYLGSTWEDRSMLIRGPALLALKEAARDLLVSQGFHADEIPEPLEPIPLPADYAEKVSACREMGWTTSAMQVQNVTGYGRKPVDLVKAILYTAMPDGSHLYVPDALWISPYWGSMLVGAALRGCVVLVVSPSVKNAPSSGAPQMSLANELFTRFMIIQKEMREEIADAGGVFKVGIYNVDSGVADLPGQTQNMYRMLTQQDELRRVFPFDTSVVRLLKDYPARLTQEGFKPSYLAGGLSSHKPQMHLKAQFFASPLSIQTVTPLLGWCTLFEKYLVARARQVTHGDSVVDAKELRASMAEDQAALYGEWLQNVPAEERGKAVFYLTLGSHNEDYRSMVMDGEDLLVVGRVGSLVAYLDFVSLLGQVTWLDDQAQLEALIPARTGFWQWFGGFMKLAL